MKTQLNLRISNDVKNVINLKSNELKLSKSELVEEAILKLFDRRKDDLAHQKIERELQNLQEINNKMFGEILKIKNNYDPDFFAKVIVEALNKM